MVKLTTFLTAIFILFSCFLLAQQGSMRDYGDSPSTYEENLSGIQVPAQNIPSEIIKIGGLADLELFASSVGMGLNNNSPNGDGLDEDGFVPSVITGGVAYSANVNVTNTCGAAKTLYGWLDLNNNGHFESTELSSVSVPNGTINQAKTLIWNGFKTNQIVTSKVYLRLRFQTGTITSTTGAVDFGSIGDGAGGDAASVSLGEVEDYQLDVTPFKDFGDSPLSYDQTSTGVLVPAQALVSSALYLGGQPDVEGVPLSVLSGSSCNGTNGDGSDENGASPGALTGGSVYSLSVTVTNTSGASRLLYGWIDFNNNGHYESTELATVSVANGLSGGTVTLSWSAVQTSQAMSSLLYLRLRIQAGTVTSAAGVVDPASIGDGVGGNSDLPLAGEIEDYSISVAAFKDFGDAPSSYDTYTNGSFIPAQNTVSSTLYLGSIPDLESSAQSVSSGSSCNGSNGDGLDENGCSPGVITGNSIYSISVTATNTTGVAKALYGWIDFNNSGKFESTELTSVSVPNGTTNGVFTLSWPATKTALINSSSVYLRLRLQSGTVTSAAGVIDPASIGDGAGGDFGTISVGEVEDYQLSTTAFKDYGDTPDSYDRDANGVLVPAQTFSSSTLRIGGAPDVEYYVNAVSTGSNNNGSNGDGIDEDGFTPSPISGGSSYTATVTVTNTTAAAKTLYGWIDLDNDGKFESTEIKSVSVGTGVTNGTVSLTWTGAQTGTITSSKVYMRLRLQVGLVTTSTGVVDFASIGDGAGGDATAVSIGEIEDYQIDVPAFTEYGDAPLSYDTNLSGIVVPAQNYLSPTLRLGATTDAEPYVQSVISGLSNNGSNGDGVDEDGANPSSIVGGSAYVLPVIVTNTTGAAKTLYGWIDLNNSGRFESTERVSANVAAGLTNATVNLTWSATMTSQINSDKVYLRLRLQSGSMTSTTGVVDHMSLGDGTGGDANVVTIGEVEDYQVLVPSFKDYGDAPVEYEQDALGNIIPAQNLIGSTLYLGTTPDSETTGSPVILGAENNTNGDGADEDGITPGSIVGGSIYTLPVTVTNTSGSAKTLYGWIDLDNNGKFESTERSTVSVANGTTNGVVNLSWTAVQTATLSSSYAYARLRIQTGTVTPTTGIVDSAAIGDGSGGNLTGISIGEVEDFMLTVPSFKDYGDVPVDYEFTSSNSYVPAQNLVSSQIYLGSQPDAEQSPYSVLSGSDNNGTNGDGSDENGATPGPIVGGSAYTLPVTVTNTTGTTKTLYGWLDINESGRFESTERVSVSVPNGTLNGVVNLSWPSTFTSLINTDKVYLRLRLQSGVMTSTTGVVDNMSIGDGSGGNLDLISAGEIEDYQVLVPSFKDYGDVPVDYEKDGAGVVCLAQNLPSSSIRIGGLPDTESTAQSVLLDQDNNGSNGDGSDEDGASPAAIVGGSAYVLPVTVTNTTGSAKTLYGWIDIDNNGRFESVERVSAVVANGLTNGTVNLTWTAANTSQIFSPNVYMRLRLQSGTVTPTVGIVDSAAIGDGAGGNFTAISTGEVEDYLIPVQPFKDFGDVPVYLDVIPSTGLYMPAQNLVSSTLSIGGVADVEGSPQFAQNFGDDINGLNGDGADENGATPGNITIGSTYSVPVTVTNTTGASKVLTGWIDFNNSLSFESTEKATVTVPNGTVNGVVTLTWSVAQTSGLNDLFAYMRLRLQSGTLTTTTGTIDFASIGDGTGGDAATVSIGEVEDYRVFAETPNVCENSSFANNNFTFWAGTTGTYSNPYSTPGIVTGRQTIITTQAIDTNTCGGVQMIPNGYSRSCRLGNSSTGAQAESLTYSIFVDSTNTLFSYMYALVLQDPGHTPIDQPKFTVEILNQSYQVIDSDCGVYNVYGGQPGQNFLTCGINNYLPWQKVALDLTPYIGQVVKIRFTTYDCDAGGHFGYAYIASDCDVLELATDYCTGAAETTVSAPVGFSGYTWDVGGSTPSIVLSNTSGIDTVSCTMFTYTNDDKVCPVSISAPVQLPVIQSNLTYSSPCTDTIDFTSTTTTTNTTVASYLWTFSDGTTSTVQNPSHFFTQPYNGGSVNLTVTDTAGCITSVEGIVVCSIPLGINWKYLNLSNEENGVKLNWGIEANQMITKFEIYTSQNATDWELIGIKNISINDETDEFEMIHEVQKYGTSYYFIDAIDENGASHKSEIKTIFRNDSSKQIYLYPNPANNYVIIKKTKSKLDCANIRIFSVSGNEIDTKCIKQSESEILIDTNSLENGIYLINVLDEQFGNECLKLHVKH